MGALEAFLVVARHRTLAAASAELNLSVSALSRRIQSLEAHVARPLFARLHHELRLTPDGEWLVEEATPAFDTLARAIGELREAGAHSLSIGVPPSFAGAWLLPRLNRFKQANPDVEISFDSSGAPFSKLGTSLDAAIVFAEEVAGDLYARELRPQTVFAVCAPGFLEPDDDARSATGRHTLLVHKGLPKTLSCWLAAMNIDEAALRRVEYYDSGPMLIAAAESGLGIALPLADSVHFYRGDPRLERPFGEAVATPYSYHLICRQSGLRGRALRRFHDWIVAEASADRHSAPAVAERKRAAS
jgi:LysR family glycine cleavage system transcriptional activator